MSSGLTDINHGSSHGVLDANLNHSPSMLTPDPQYLAPCLLFLILNAISNQIRVRACTSNHSPFATCPRFAALRMDIVPEPEGVLFSVLPIMPVLIQTKSDNSMPEPFELKTGGIVVCHIAHPTFSPPPPSVIFGSLGIGIDIASEDNKTIPHHKVTARVICILTEQEVPLAARVESPSHLNHSNHPGSSNGTDKRSHLHQLPPGVLMPISESHPSPSQPSLFAYIPCVHFHWLIYISWPAKHRIAIRQVPPVSPFLPLHPSPPSPCTPSLLSLLRPLAQAHLSFTYTAAAMILLQVTTTNLLLWRG
jgi:hypothetical protein